MDSSFFFLRICAAAIGFFTILMVYKKFRSNQQNKTMPSDEKQQKTMPSSSSHPSSLPSSLARNWEHDVFPSFHGPDVHRTFFGHIFKEFRSKGIDIFIDNEIKRSPSIGPELVEAIRRSKIAIVMISRNYASSSWCLDELVEIMICKEELDQRVVVVFYEVDPTDVRKQTGDFGKCLIKTCKGKTRERIEKWRQALEKVAIIAGYDSRQWQKEASLIENIAADISNMLINCTPSRDFDGLVGMGAHMENMEPMLCLDSDEVRMIGILGPPGIGKTTLTRFLFNQLSNQFQYSIFMENIKRCYPIPCYDAYSAQLQLQADFLSRLMKQKDIRIPHLGFLQERLKDKKILVVLDDVDSLEQLYALAKETQWYGPGSRIIITTQDLKLLKAHGINHIYWVDFPAPDQAFQIFCIYAFGQKSPDDGFMKLAHEVIQLAGKLPLRLKVMGSYFRGMSMKEWDKALPRLRTMYDTEIGNVTCTGFSNKLASDYEGLVDPGSRIISTTQDLRNLKAHGIKHIYRIMDHRSYGVAYISCADTLQYSFASYLSVEFRRKGIRAFVNCNGTLDVIEEARASVVVFSENYLSSTSCLDKLQRVLQCRRKNGQLVVPVFYGISPSDIMVPERNSADRIIEWSNALQELRVLPGHQFRERFSECELVEEIVKDVYEKLFPAENIGIDSKLQEIGHLLRKQTWDVRRIGIWGMPGIGKTTLANTVFDQISGGYEASCFIKHFDKAFHEKGIHRLIGDHFGNILKELPSKKRTLVVLDDVYNPLVAESFLRGLHWFGPGSLIIITSRDKQVFRLCQINHVYEVQSLNENEALQLFSLCAFGKDIREQNLLKLSMEVIDYASGNPLALSFYGRELEGKKLSEMETTFLKLKLRTPCKIYDLFKSSYVTLNKNEKNIFLDIACFFKGENVDYVMQLLEGCGFFPHVGIDALVEKCLLTISEDRMTMHRIIQDFGREIINGETVQIERRRRLWEPWTIQFLLEDDKLEANGDPKRTYRRALGSEHIEGIYMDTLNLIFDVKPAAFKNMCNLRFLKIYCSSYKMHFGPRLPKGLDSLPYKLRLLHWENYPLRSLPQDFNPCHLVELNMPYSQLQKLWEGTKNLEMLKMVKLCHSQQLTEIDDICEAQNIELLDLQGCTKLKSFPAMCQLQHLRVVNLSGCREIKIFPEVSPNIEVLHLQGTGIRELPISSVTLPQPAKLNRVRSNLLTEFPGASVAMNVEQLTSLVKFNSFNQHLSKLVCLNMKDCSNFRSLPDMVDLESLKFLDMSGCSELEHIQGFPRNLKELYIAGTVIKELPPLPQSLEVLNAHGCVSLKTIPSGFKQLPRNCTFSNCFSLSAEVVSEYLKNALAYVECTAREYQQKQESNKSLAFSFSVSSPAKENFTFHLHPGYSVLIRMSPSWRSTLVAFAILVEAAFSDDYQKANFYGFKCVCRWKDKEGLSHRLEKTFHCWTPGEGVQQFQKEHIFLFCDLNLHPSTSTGKDPDIFADLIVLEIFPVNKQLKLIDESCTVTRCGIYVINSAYADASLRTSQPVLSLDCPKMLSDDEVEEVLRGLEEKDRFLFLYIACLVNDAEAELVAPLIASIGLGVSSGFKVLADNSLICISTDGVIVRRYLVETMGRSLSVDSACCRIAWNYKPSLDSGELVGIEDHVADMNFLLSSKSEEVKVVGICGLSGKGNITIARALLSLLSWRPKNSLSDSVKLRSDLV